MWVAVLCKDGIWRRWDAPFRCFCCGKVICKKQFMFSSTCGYCDTGACTRSRHRRDPRHPNRVPSRGPLHSWAPFRMGPDGERYYKTGVVVDAPVVEAAPENAPQEERP